MKFDIPRNVILPVDSMDIRLNPGVFLFEVDHASAIEANWHDEYQANPALFDGRMLLLTNLTYKARRISGNCYEVRYATLLYWRRNKRALGVEHCFIYAVLAASDNALVAVRMGDNTANAGLVYFAAGSFEKRDVIDGTLDPYANMRREVLEETGLDLADFKHESGWNVYSHEGTTVLFQRFSIPEDAETVAAKIRAHAANEAQPEIEEPVIIRGVDDLPSGLAVHMVPVIRWHFRQRGKPA